jgi:hypothetical protein
MATPMEIIAQAARIDKTPRTGAMPSVNVTPSVPVPTVAPMAQVAPQLSPTAQYINDMQTLLRGGIGKLSTGEKLGAVGQILQAAGSRGAADPGAVIQNVRQQQMQKLNAQYQIAQLQQKQQQEQQQIAAIQKYSALLTENERAALEGLPLEKRAEKISEIAFRPKQVQQIVRSSDGKTRIVYQNGDAQIADWSLPPKTKYENLNDRLVLVDEDTGKPVLDENGKQQTLKVNMTPAQAASYGLDLARFNRGDGRGGGGDGGDGGSWQWKEIGTDKGTSVVLFNPKTKAVEATPYKPATSGYMAPPPPLVNPGGKKRY